MAAPSELALKQLLDEIQNQNEEDEDDEEEEGRALNGKILQTYH